MPVVDITKPKFTEEQIARFWSHVQAGEENECWLWLGYKTSRGYGSFCASKRKYGAHVVARFLATGEWPGNLFTCHHCDNRPCCNPSHLFLGTNRDNALDMTAKGRHANNKGIRNGRAKLNETQVAEIRRLHGSGWSQRKLAAWFCVSKTLVADIIRRRRWRCVE